MLKHPEISQTEAYLRHHNTNNRHTARHAVSELVAKPAAQIYLQEHINKAKQRVVTLVDSEKEDIALRASDSILDRALGKATQRTEQQTTVVSINLDLTQVTDT